MVLHELPEPAIDGPRWRRRSGCSGPAASWSSLENRLIGDPFRDQILEWYSQLIDEPFWEPFRHLNLPAKARATGLRRGDGRAVVRPGIGPGARGRPPIDSFTPWGLMPGTQGLTPRPDEDAHRHGRRPSFPAPPACSTAAIPTAWQGWCMPLLIEVADLSERHPPGRRARLAGDAPRRTDAAAVPGPRRRPGRPGAGGGLIVSNPTRGPARARPAPPSAGAFPAAGVNFSATERASCRPSGCGRRRSRPPATGR